MGIAIANRKNRCDFGALRFLALISGICVQCSWTTDFPCNFRHVLRELAFCFAWAWTPCLEQVFPSVVIFVLGLFYCCMVVSFLCCAFWWCVAFLFLSLSLLFFFVMIIAAFISFAIVLFLLVVISFLVVASGAVLILLLLFLFLLFVALLFVLFLIWFCFWFCFMFLYWKHVHRPSKRRRNILKRKKREDNKNIEKNKGKWIRRRKQKKWRLQLKTREGAS